MSDKAFTKGTAALAGQPNTLTALTYGVSMFRADVGYGAVSRLALAWPLSKVS